MKYFLCILSMLILSASISAEETLKACGHHDYAPWNWKKGNKIVGACAEITKTLFEKAGVKVDLSYVGPWKRCQHNIEQGKIDVNICAFINESRKEYSKFILTPMGFNENAVFVHKDRPFPFKDWNDLKAKRAGMVLGVSIGQKFDDFLKTNTEIDRVPSFEANFHKLAIHRVDFIPVGRYSGIAMLHAFNLDQKIIDLPTPILSGNLYISMSKKSKFLHLLPEVEKMMKSKIYYNWVDELLNKHVQNYKADYKRIH